MKFTPTGSCDRFVTIGMHTDLFTLSDNKVYDDSRRLIYYTFISALAVQNISIMDYGIEYCQITIKMIISSVSKMSEQIGYSESFASFTVLCSKVSHSYYSRTLLQIEMEFMYSQNGKKLLIVDKYNFFLHNTAKSGQNLSVCQSKIYTNNTEDEIIEKNIVLIHNHDEDTTLNRHEEIVIEDNIIEKPSKFIITEIKNFNNENNLKTTDLNYIRRNVYNARKSILPPLPKSIEEVHDTLNLMDLKTNRSEQFLFTIHDFKNQNCISLVFALLPDKNSHTYSTLFLKTIEICLQNNLRLQPVTVV
ncbi:protein sneaky, partial [Aphis craccivora]